MRIALIEPDIPQNVGAVLRLGACLGVGVDLIGPFGFVATDRRMRRAGMDYVDLADHARHQSLAAYLAERTGGGRLALLTTAGDVSPYDFAFHPDDTLMFGAESKGAPPAAHAAADVRLALPMRAGARSFNLATAAALALGEALRQTGGLPPLEAQKEPGL